MGRFWAAQKFVGYCAIRYEAFGSFPAEANLCRANCSRLNSQRGLHRCFRCDYFCREGKRIDRIYTAMEEGEAAADHLCEARRG